MICWVRKRPARRVEAEPSVLRAADQVSREEVELRERSLLYVAATRARDELLVTSYGEPSGFLKNFYL